MGVRVLRTPPFAPQANCYCERLIGTTRRECLDFLIPLSENHLRRVLAEWRDYYNQARPHSSLGPNVPEPASDLPGRACFAEALHSNWISRRFPADSRRAPSRLSVGAGRLTERVLSTSALKDRFPRYDRSISRPRQHMYRDQFRQREAIGNFLTRPRPPRFFSCGLQVRPILLECQCGADGS